MLTEGSLLLVKRGSQVYGPERTDAVNLHDSAPVEDTEVRLASWHESVASDAKNLKASAVERSTETQLPPTRKHGDVFVTRVPVGGDLDPSRRSIADDKLPPELPRSS